MAMVIRVAYNNQDWRAPCKTPGQDRLCQECFKDILDIEAPKKDDVICSGHCWEQHLCNDYKWGCTPKGRVYGSRAKPGTTVFFVFKQPDGNYTIWGKTSVAAVDTRPMENEVSYEQGFSFIHFEDFDPLPREKWVADISDVNLVGAKWLQGRHRFIDDDQEQHLLRLTEGNIKEEKPATVVIGERHISVDLHVNVVPNIHRKLENLAKEEGRQINDCIREAIAEWIRNRG